MPAVSFYRHGITAYIPNLMGNPDPPKRGRITGWSAAAARRNTNFLRSVDERKLDGVGYALTLTVKSCPPTPAAWTSLVQAWVKRQARGHMRRLHWVMEFQRRAVPHLHAAIWYASQLPEEDEYQARVRILKRQHRMIEDWVELATPYGAGIKGQHWRLIDGPVGWFAYLAKHCSRSKFHYQRQRDAVPQAWESSPRVWGNRGDWPTAEPVEGTLSLGQFHRLRRLVRKGRLAEARAALPLNSRQFGKLRREPAKLLKREASEVQPISEWLTQDRQRELLRALAAGVDQGEVEMVQGSPGGPKLGAGPARAKAGGTRGR